jgi:translin
MKNLDAIMERINQEISAKEKVREEALRFSRDIIINCRKAIQHLHRDLMPAAQEFIGQAGAILSQLVAVTKDHPDIFYAGYVENAEQEFVEASCLLSILQAKNLPNPADLNVTSSSYLMGLCDLVGELRRAALDVMLEGDTAKATNYLKMMDQIYDSIMSFDYPSGLVPIKKKQDVVRSLVEKTRGELVVVSSERRMEERSREVHGILEKTEGEKPVRKRQAAEGEPDLDVDKVW